MDITVKQHDTKGKFTDVLTLNNQPIDLTDCDVLFLMKGGKIALATSATVVDPIGGSVEYQPTSTDVATAGRFRQEWQITFPSGEILTVPNDSYNTITIMADLGPAS